MESEDPKMRDVFAIVIAHAMITSTKFYGDGLPAQAYTLADAMIEESKKVKE